MRSPALLTVCVYLHCISAGHADEPTTRKAEADNREFLLTIDALHALNRDELQQDIVVKEDTSFFVSTRVGEVRWTFSGDVYRVVHGHLPILIRSRWYLNAESNSTSTTPMLMKIDGKPTSRVGAFNSQGLSLTVRETTVADGLPGSEVMERALERKIRELNQAQDTRERANSRQ